MSEFHSGLFSCCSDMGTCILGCYCPFLLSVHNQRKLEGVHSCRHWCMPISEYNIRQIIRQRANYDSAGCSDCIEFAFCYPCFTCQNARELDEGFGLPLKGEGYKGHIAGKDHDHKEKKEKHHHDKEEQDGVKYG